jgi:hypothetical protein
VENFIWSALLTIISIIVFVIGVRVMLLWPSIVIQLDVVDKPIGGIQYIKAFIGYLLHPERLQKSIDL